MRFYRAFSLSIALLSLAACSNKVASAGRPVAPAAPVAVSMAATKSIPFEIQAVGNAEAYATVSIKAQVGGQLTVVDFQEGAEVKKGDRLFVIDPRPYQSQVTQAEANLARDKAQLGALQANLARDMAQEEYAQAQATRYAELTRRGVVPKESSEQTSTQAAAAREGVRADKAGIESAQANIAAE